MTHPLLTPRSAIERERLLNLSTDIAVCVHDGLDYVRPCLMSVTENLHPGDRLIVVDDGSGEPTRSYLQTFMGDLAGEHVYIRHENACGYTAAANVALQCSQADYIILLNSDAVVTQDWSTKLKEVGESAPDIGVVGPMSNAASWQSIPSLLDERGDHAINEVPPGWTVGTLDRLLELRTPSKFPRVPLINGFCFAIKRALVDKIGLLDEETFPHYGEENDYCFRMTDAGFMGAIATHTYVYHAKSKSYSHERRRPLIERNSRKWRELYGTHRVTNAFETMRKQPVLARLRCQTRRLWTQSNRYSRNGRAEYSVLYLFPAEGAPGSVRGVVQDAFGLTQLGVLARVAIPQRLLASHRRLFPQDRLSGLLLGYANELDLLAQASGFDVVVAGVESSVQTLASICAINEDVLPACLVQASQAELAESEAVNGCAASGSRAGLEVAEAASSRIDEAILFAKTWGLCRAVESLHGVRVFKVTPSLDTDVFHPPALRGRPGVVRIAGLVRGGARWDRADLSPLALVRLHEEFGAEVEIHFYGGSDDDLREAGFSGPIEFHDHGVLGREDAADLLRSTDIFVDFSQRRGSGSIGLEAMACDVAVVLPALAGVHEFARQDWNALLIGTGFEASCLEALRRLVTDEGLRTRLRRRGLSTARRYSIREAASSQHVLFRTALRAHRASRVGRSLALSRSSFESADRSNQ